MKFNYDTQTNEVLTLTNLMHNRSSGQTVHVHSLCHSHPWHWCWHKTGRTYHRMESIWLSNLWESVHVVSLHVRQAPVRALPKKTSVKQKNIQEHKFWNNQWNIHINISFSFDNQQFRWIKFMAHNEFKRVLLQPCTDMCVSIKWLKVISKWLYNVHENEMFHTYHYLADVSDKLQITQFVLELNIYYMLKCEFAKEISPSLVGIYMNMDIIIGTFKWNKNENMRCEPE